VLEGVVESGCLLSRQPLSMSNRSFLLCTVYKNIHGVKLLKIRRVVICGVWVSGEIHDGMYF